ncbi:hypothetical protein ES705_30797 [subsurface metagenome]
MTFSRSFSSCLIVFIFGAWLPEVITIFDPECSSLNFISDGSASITDIGTLTAPAYSIPSSHISQSLRPSEINPILSPLLIPMEISPAPNFLASCRISVYVEPSYLSPFFSHIKILSENLFTLSSKNCMIVFI